MSKRVVIVGAGFGGAFTAKYLRRFAPKELEIELINDTNYFVFQPLLPEVASGTISAPDAVTPLRLLLPGVKVRMAEVRGVDFVAKEVHLVQGSKRKLLKLGYDQLVLACGQKTDLSRLPGFAEHSLTMKDLADAHGLRNHVIQCLEHADVTDDAALKKRLLTFVVAGGGFSGVETMGEMAEMVTRTLKYYPNIRLEELRGVLIQRGERILPELPATLGEYARDKLSKRGIEIRLKTSIVSATATAVELDDGTKIGTNTLVTTVGSGPSDLVKQLPIELNRGRIATDGNLRVRGWDDVWAVGDAALIPLPAEPEAPASFAPPTAQFAVREAKCLAGNISRAVEGRPLTEFAYAPRGSLASIGNYKAVAEVFGVRISGVFAWLLWRGFYISMLPSFVTRLRIGLNWLFDYFLPRSIVQITQKNPSACRFVCFAKGDIIFRPGQTIDGFYTVVSGALESSVPDPSVGEDFVRVLGPGDHWGERTISGALETMGTLTAIKDSRVLVLKREDFNYLRQTFRPLNDYFAGIHESMYPEPLRTRSPRGSE